MCGDSHGIPATAAPSPDSGRGGKWSASRDVSVMRHVLRASRAGVDHVEGDPVPDAGEAVPQELDEDGGDGELHVGDKQRHGDGARPPALRGAQHFNFQHKSVPRLPNGTVFGYTLDRTAAAAGSLPSLVR